MEEPENPAHTSPAEKELVLQELVRQAEESIEHQLYMLERQHASNNNAARISMALLTVMLSGTALLLHTGPKPDLAGLTILTASMIVAAWTTVSLVLLSAGARDALVIAVGIRPRALLKIAHKQDPALRPLLLSTLAQLDVNWRTNQHRLRQLTERRDRAVLWLFSTFGAFLIGTVYTLSTPIFG